jgi:hypothetical protein
MRTPEFFSDAEARLRSVTFEDIEIVYGDLVLHKHQYGASKWLTVKTDKPGCDMRAYFEDEMNAKQAIRSSAKYVHSKWLGKSVEASFLLEKIRAQIDHVISVYTLSIWTVADVQGLQRLHHELLPKDTTWCPGMSYDLLRTMYGNYAHIQVRPGRIVLNADGSVESKDPYEFLIKVFETPAHPSYLELINQRVFDWSH